MKNLLLLLIFGVVLFSCKDKPEEEPLPQKDLELEELVNLMTGSFNNAKQAAKDTTYRDVTLHMYPIWPEREGYWLYAEQSLSDNQEKPYRQRIYEISRENDSVYRSDAYTFPNENLWACKWQTPESFERLLPETLSLREGCEIRLKRTAENSFQGKTTGKNCPSELNGASYTTSEVEISKKGIIVWDRGFNKNDSLVWGPEKSGYVFDKLLQ